MLHEIVYSSCNHLMDWMLSSDNKIHNTDIYRHTDIYRKKSSVFGYVILGCECLVILLNAVGLL